MSITNTQDVRAYFLKNIPKPKTIAVDADHVLFPEAEIVLKELDGITAYSISESCLRPDGTMNQKAFNAKVLIASLCNAVNGEQLLQEADRDELMSGGMSFLQPLAMQAIALSGLDNEAIELAKKNLKPIHLNGSVTPSPTSSDTSA